MVVWKTLLFYSIISLNLSQLLKEIFNDVSGIFFEKTDKKTLAVLLFLMANMPLVHPTYNENIYNIYLDKIFTNASYHWNKFLEDIENS